MLNMQFFTSALPCMSYSLIGRLNSSVHSRKAQFFLHKSKLLISLPKSDFRGRIIHYSSEHEHATDLSSGVDKAIQLWIRVLCRRIYLLEVQHLLLSRNRENGSLLLGIVVI